MKFLVLPFLVFALITTGTVEASEKDWDVGDSVSYRYFSSSWENPTFGGPPAAPLVSPDAKYFAIMTHRGEIECDCNRYQLDVFSSEEVARQLILGSKSGRPLKSVAMTSISGSQWYGAAIFDVKWMDGKTLVFRGSGSSADFIGLYMLSLPDGHLKLLSSPGQNVEKFDVRGDTALYTTSRELNKSRNDVGIPSGVDQYPLQSLNGGYPYGGGFHPFLSGSDRDRYEVGVSAVRDGRRIDLLPAREVPTPFTSAPVLSPDGNYAVFSEPLPIGTVPTSWSTLFGLDAPYSLMPLNQIVRLQKIRVSDLRTGTSKVVLDMPLGTSEPTEFVWAPDSSTVLISNVTVRSDSGNDSAGHLIVYDVGTGKSSPVVPMVEKIKGAVTRISAIRRSSSAIFLRRITTIDGKSKFEPWENDFTFSSNGVSPATSKLAEVRPEQASLPHSLELSFIESANQPTRLEASIGDRRAIIVGPDPVTQNRRLRPFSQVSWMEQGGHQENGGLIVPEGSGPFPLVIQLEQFQPSHFFPDGTSERTAYAAQSLAANGMAVLQLNPFPRNKAFGPIGTRPTPGALKELVARIDAAVASLEKKGIIDRNRVGLIGFSYTGFVAYYAASHHGRVVPAAVIVADSLNRTYGEYTTSAAIMSDYWTGEKGPVVSNIERDWGGNFWDPDARKIWLENSPSFNIDKIESPIMFIYAKNVGGFPAFLAESIGAFRLNRREADVRYFPRGAHQLVLPRERQASLQASLEWMSFWLKGQEIAPEKVDQYWYWRKLREQRDKRRDAEAQSKNLP